MTHSLHVLVPLSCELRSFVPQAIHGDRVDHRELGFVHPVHAGMPVAEVVVAAGAHFAPASAAALLGEGCALAHRHDAPGETGGETASPVPVVATRDGHLEWDGGRLVVRETLAVGADITYRIGNIRYPGDLVVRGMVRTAFHLHARAMRIEGLLEGAYVECETLDAQGGIKAGSAGRIRAGTALVATFMENANASAGARIDITGSALHNDLCGGEGIHVGGRLIGGTASAGGWIEIGERLGGGLSTPTRVQVGYDPFTIRALRRIDTTSQHIEEIMLACAGLAECGGMLGERATARGERLARALRRLRDHRDWLHRQLATTPPPDTCAVIVHGEVRPGVEILIGPARLMNHDFLTDVRFEYRDGTVHTSHPARRTP